MILDSTKGFEKYIRLHERFGEVFNFLRKTDLRALSAGEYPIDGKKSYCKIWDGEGKGLDIPKLEVHDNYIDIHLLLEGNETIGFKDRSNCLSSDATYNEAEDIAFFDEDPDVFINLGIDNSAIFFPSDAHAPLIGEGKIKKAIIKVLV